MIFLINTGGMNRSYFSGKQYFKLVAFASLLIVASAIGISRIVDYRHHPGDVLAGFAVGALSSVANFKLTEAKKLAQPQSHR
jgi:membrane-associated phospholipid phosphatase